MDKIIDFLISLLVCNFLIGDPGCGNPEIRNIVQSSPVHKIINTHRAKYYFEDPQLINLANAAAEGDVLKINELLVRGVDINGLGKNGLTPLFWLLVHNEESTEKKIGFRHLVKNGANVLHISQDSSDPILHLAAKYVDSDYLKIILEEQPGVDIDFERPGNSWSTPLLAAIVTDRYDSLELLIKYGVDIEKKNQLGETPLLMCISNSWREALMLLDAGADYTAQIPSSGSTIVDFIENNIYYPEAAEEYYGKDYRQKVIDFLRDKGVEVYPWYPKDDPRYSP